MWIDFGVLGEIEFLAGNRRFRGAKNGVMSRLEQGQLRDSGGGACFAGPGKGEGRNTWRL